ncbi:MAG: GNAT family N-acetyltransferase [Propionibacteriaceae bacterium]|jgi:ribosomal protein S18 acetylase RimI-like enzyme|nr:GNAT family N-acetyltransferase [Propionibacteriaceae bacterium]
MLRTAALGFLDDVAFYADMIDAVRHDATILAADSSGVLLRLGSGTYMLAAAGPEAARTLIETIDAQDCGELVVHDDEAVALAQAHLGFPRAVPCLSAAYLGPARPCEPRPDLRVSPLGAEWAGLVSAHYGTDLVGREYVVERLAAHAVWGAFRGDELVGFIGLHPEGAMGMLEVVPAYRRQGIAAHLLAGLTNRQLARGRLPYDHIIVGNVASEALQRKLGFTISTRRLTWVTPARS